MSIPSGTQPGGFIAAPFRRRLPAGNSGIIIRPRAPRQPVPARRASITERARAADERGRPARRTVGGSGGWQPQYARRGDHVIHEPVLAGLLGGEPSVPVTV